MLIVRNHIKHNQAKMALCRRAREQFRAGRHQWHNQVEVPTEVTIAELARQISELLAANLDLRNYLKHALGVALSLSLLR